MQDAHAIRKAPASFPFGHLEFKSLPGVSLGRVRRLPQRPGLGELAQCQLENRFGELFRRPRSDAPRQLAAAG
jgi:hypothetical protein